MKTLLCRCGNKDQDKFETVTGGYSAPKRDGYRGAIVLKGCACMVCGMTYLTSGEPASLTDGRGQSSRD